MERGRASVVDFFSTAAGAQEFHSLDFEGGELAAVGDADAVGRGAASMVVARNTGCGDVSHDGADALDDVGGGGSSVVASWKR